MEAVYLSFKYETERALLLAQFRDAMFLAKMYMDYAADDLTIFLLHNPRPSVYMDSYTVNLRHRIRSYRTLAAQQYAAAALTRERITKKDAGFRLMFNGQN